jgi:hypothetical protein
MIRVPRLVLCILLVLTQVLAPWVHAHLGVETGGFLHLPGLEMAAKTDPGCADASPGDRDVIVGMQAGVWDQSKLVRSDPGQPDHALAPAEPAPASVRPDHAQPLATAPPVPYPASRYRSHPRAPPRA